MDSSDAWRYALTIFLIATGLSLSYVFLRMSGHSIGDDREDSS